MNQIESKTRNQLDVKKNNVGKKILHIAGRLTGGINFVRQKGHLRRKGKEVTREDFTMES